MRISQCHSSSLSIALVAVSLPSTLLTSHLALLLFTHFCPLSRPLPHVTGLGRCGSLVSECPPPLSSTWFVLIAQSPVSSDHRPPPQGLPLTTLSAENNPNHFLCYHLPMALMEIITLQALACSLTILYLSVSDSTAVFPCLQFPSQSLAQA